MDVGSSIKELRLARGLTQEALARTLFVSRQTISHWESGRTAPDAQSLVMMGALFGVTVDALVKGGVEAMVAVEAQERRRARVSYATAAGIGLVGAAAVAPALVPELGTLGGMLSLAPIATALAVAGVSRARSHADAPLSVLREALESNVELRIHAEGGPRDLTATILDARGEQPYRIRHTASVPRGERWQIADAAGRTVARVAYRIVMTGAPLPWVDAKVEGIGTITMRKMWRQRTGLAEVWELEGCGASIRGNWLGEKVELQRDDRHIATVEFTDRDALLRVPNGSDVLLALTLCLMLALVRATEHH